MKFAYGRRTFEGVSALKADGAALVIKTREPWCKALDRVLTCTLYRNSAPSPVHSRPPANPDTVQKTKMSVRPIGRVLQKVKCADKVTGYAISMNHVIVVNLLNLLQIRFPRVQLVPHLVHLFRIEVRQHHELIKKVPDSLPALKAYPPMQDVTARAGSTSIKHR